MKTHNYKSSVRWTGNKGEGTSTYQAYGRNHTISIDGKYEEILASSDPNFLGDKSRYNPEDLFLSSLSACHMLWYLHLCTVNKIVVEDYVDHATGVMEESSDGSGKFSSVILHPHVIIRYDNNIDLANSLHHQANKMCFIANSCNFPIGHEPTTRANLD